MSETPNWETFDSRIEIRATATATIPLGYRRGSPQQNSRHGDHEVRFETEGDIVHDERLGVNIVNVDAYLSTPREMLSDYGHEFSGDDVDVVTDYSDVEVLFDVYEDELRKAAKVRAAEDGSHEVNVLAEWLWQAAPADHVSKHEATIFYRALERTVEDEPETPEWALAYDGDPERHRADCEPITTLEAARKHAQGTPYDIAAQEQPVDRGSDDIEADTPSGSLFRQGEDYDDA